MREEFVDPEIRTDEEVDSVEDGGLRPRTLDEFVGQRELKEHLNIVLKCKKDAVDIKVPYQSERILNENYPKNHPVKHLR